LNATNINSGKPKISTAYVFDHYASKEDVAVLVEEEDFVAAERELVPSVSAKELEHYSKVRAQFEKVEDNPSSSQDGKEKNQAQGDGIPDWQQAERPGGMRGVMRTKMMTSTMMESMGSLLNERIRGKGRRWTWVSRTVLRMMKGCISD
jgi:hypothetical protein